MQNKQNIEAIFKVSNYFLSNFQKANINYTNLKIE